MEGGVLPDALERFAHGTPHERVLDAALVQPLQDLDGGGEILLGALQVGQHQVRPGVVVILRQRRLDLRLGAHERLQLDVDARQGDVRLGVHGGEGLGLTDGGDGVVVKLLARVGHPEPGERAGEIRLHRDRLQEELDGVLRPVLAQEQIPQVRVGVGEGDVDLESLVVLRLRLVVLAHRLEQPSQPVVGRGVSRLQLEGAQVLGTRLAGVPLLQAGVPQRQVGLHVVGLQVEGDLERLDRLAVAPIGVQADPQVVERQEGVEIDVNDLLQGLDGILVLPLPVEAHPFGLQLEGLRASIRGGDGEGRRGERQRAGEQGGGHDPEAHQYALSSFIARARSSTWGRMRFSRPGSYATNVSRAATRRTGASRNSNSRSAMRAAISAP